MTKLKVDEYYLRLYRESLSQAEVSLEKSKEYLMRAGLENTTFESRTRLAINKIHKLLDWSAEFFTKETEEKK